MPKNSNSFQFRRNRWPFVFILAALFVLSCSLTTGILRGQATETPGSASAAPGVPETALPEPVPGEGPSPDTLEAAGGGWIAFLGTDGNIYTITGGGRQRNPITTDARPPAGTQSASHIYQHPTWGPKGERLAYREILDAPGTPQQAILHTVDPDGKNPADAFRSTTFFPFYLYWSPDGSSLTFLSNNPIGGRLILHEAPADGGEPHILGRGQPFYWDWSPDGEDLIAHTGGASRLNSDARLAFLIQGGQQQVADLTIQPGFFQAPAWAPTGDSVLLVTEGSEERDRLVLADRLGENTQILKEFDGAGYFSWAPDGSQIGILEQIPTASGELEGVLSLLDPSHPEQAKTLAQGRILVFFWSPDSQKLMYISQPADLGDFNVSLRAQDSPIQLGLHVVDLSTGITRRLVSFNPPLDYRNVLPFFDQYQRSHSFWSPDSRWLVYASQEKNDTPGIYVISASGDHPAVRIADGTVAFWSPR